MQLAAELGAAKAGRELTASITANSAATVNNETMRLIEATSFFVRYSRLHHWLPALP